jgi:hypothetical protein
MTSRFRRLAGFKDGSGIISATEELNAEVTLFVQSRGTADELGRPCHAYPTLSEAMLGAMARSNRDLIG